MLEIYGIALLSNHHFPADGTAADMNQKSHNKCPIAN